MVDLRPYAGRWVALVTGRVAGSGRTPAEARQMATRNRPKERPQIGFVAPGGEPGLMSELPLTALMEELRPLLAVGGQPVYLVGGAVRDALLGRVSHDLDFAVGSGAVSLARAVADALGGAFYLLDAERGTARGILGDSVMDFALFRGEDLLEDLRHRDFTINAMALPADSSDPDAVIDPVGGQSDLAAGVIRATGPTAIRDDHIRGLRAVRLAAELDLRIAAETSELIRAGSAGLAAVSAERVRDEFCRLMVAPHPARSVRMMDQLGLLQSVLPELAGAKGVQCPHDLFEHTLLTLEQLEALVEGFTPAVEAEGGLALAHETLAPYAPRLAEHLARPTAGGRNGRVLLFLGALLHGVGMPGTRSEGEDGRVQYPGHERLAAEKARRRSRAMALSNAEVLQVMTLVDHHTVPARLSTTSPDGVPSRRSIYRFYRDAGPMGLDVCMLYLADGLARRGSGDEGVAWERRLRTVNVLLDHYVNRYLETISPPALLGGRELMSALGLRPGPEVGRLLQVIEEAQAAGQVSTLEGALTLAREAHRPAGSPPPPTGRTSSGAPPSPGS